MRCADIMVAEPSQLVAAALFDVALAWVILRMVAPANACADVGPACGSVPAPSDGWPCVAVVVAAMNGADVVGARVAGLLAQDCPRDDLGVVLVDDGSTDGTVEAVRAAAGGDPRLRVLQAGPPPPGWTGKARARGAAQAGEGWLCFMDADTRADTRAEPALLRAAVAEARRRGLGLPSLEPFQELGGAAVNDPGSDAAAADGHFMLFAPGTCAALGTQAAVRAAVGEDLALAHRAKRAGLGFALLGAETLIRTRMYGDAHRLRHGLSKTVTVLGGGARRTLIIAAGIALPAWAAVRFATGTPGAADLAAAVLALGGLPAVLGLHAAGAGHFRIPPVDALAFPTGYAVAVALAANAARLRRLGRVRWKDRTVEAPAGAEP